MLKRNVRHNKIIRITRKMFMQNLIAMFRKKITKFPGMVKGRVPFAVRKVSYFSEDLVLNSF